MSKSGIKYIFHYLQRIIDSKLFYSKETTSLGLVGYTDARYKSDPHKPRSQTDFLFCYYSITISWRFAKQMLVVTFTNHSKIITLYMRSIYCIDSIHWTLFPFWLVLSHWIFWLKIFNEALEACPRIWIWYLIQGNVKINFEFYIDSAHIIFENYPTDKHINSKDYHAINPLSLEIIL